MVPDTLWAKAAKAIAETNNHGIRPVVGNLIFQACIVFSLMLDDGHPVQDDCDWDYPTGNRGEKTLAVGAHVIGEVWSNLRVIGSKKPGTERKGKLKKRRGCAQFEVL